MLIVLIIIGLVASLIAAAIERELRTRHYREAWRRTDRVTRAALMIGIVMAASYGGTKGPSPVASLFRMLFWSGPVWELMDAQTDNAAASAAIQEATADLVAATNIGAQVSQFVATNSVITYSFDWHSPDRLPETERQNVLARTVWVTPTNIAGTLYEDHYVAFNAEATTNPAVIYIEYAQNTPTGVIRYTQQTVTNSYPVRVPITLAATGTHTCYWFRCEVPPAFTNAVRDWNGEALFGSPQDSNKGFDLLGTIVIDDGDNLWLGATRNVVVGSVTNTVRNGIIIE